MLTEAAEEEQQFQQFRDRNRIHHVSYIGTVGKLVLLCDYGLSMCNRGLVVSSSICLSWHAGIVPKQQVVKSYNFHNSGAYDFSFLAPNVEQISIGSHLIWDMKAALWHVSVVLRYHRLLKHIWDSDRLLQATDRIAYLPYSVI